MQFVKKVLQMNNHTINNEQLISTRHEQPHSHDVDSNQSESKHLSTSHMDSLHRETSPAPLEVDNYQTAKTFADFVKGGSCSGSSRGHSPHTGGSSLPYNNRLNSKHPFSSHTDDGSASHIAIVRRGSAVSQSEQTTPVRKGCRLVEEILDQMSPVGSELATKSAIDFPRSADTTFTAEASRSIETFTPQRKKGTSMAMSASKYRAAVLPSHAPPPVLPSTPTRPYQSSMSSKPSATETAYYSLKTPTKRISALNRTRTPGGRLSFELHDDGDDENSEDSFLEQVHYTRQKLMERRQPTAYRNYLSIGCKLMAVLMVTVFAIGLSKLVYTLETENTYDQFIA